MSVWAGQATADPACTQAADSRPHMSVCGSWAFCIQLTLLHTPRLVPWRRLYFSMSTTCPLEDCQGLGTCKGDDTAAKMGIRHCSILQNERATELRRQHVHERLWVQPSAEQEYLVKVRALSRGPAACSMAGEC